MAASPRFKIYDAQDEYIGCVKRPADAAVLVSALSEGATIRDGHAKKHTVWHEGGDGWAGDSHDHVAAHIDNVLVRRAYALSLRGKAQS